MYKYKAFTLIDITNTDAITPDDITKRNQQRNWETVNQILNYRTQILSSIYDGVIVDDVSNYSFGTNYSGKHNIWQFEFEVEYDGIFTQQNDRYSTLKYDMSLTPILLGLNETATPTAPLFITSGVDKNIYFIGIKNEDI